MTPDIRRSLKQYKHAHHEDDQFAAEEQLSDALLRWHNQELAKVVKICIRIATECLNRDTPAADVILHTFRDLI